MEKFITDLNIKNYLQERILHSTQVLFSPFDSLYIYKNTSKRRNTYNSKSEFVSCMIQKHIVDNSMLKCAQNPKKTAKNNLATFQPKAFELNLQ